MAGKRFFCWAMRGDSVRANDGPAGETFINSNTCKVHELPEICADLDVDQVGAATLRVSLRVMDTTVATRIGAGA